MPLVTCPKCEYEFDARVASCPECGEVVSAFVRQHAGALVDGKYRLLKRLGRGGMGEVFKAEHVHLGTTRVIKVMRPQIAEDQELQTRFLREAKLATLIQHPNVATLHDFSVLPDKTCYMVWEHIEGTDLSGWAKEDGRLDTRTIIELMIQALRGLRAIHSAGIVHRDISPENIMVSRGPSGFVVKLIDLGIARSDSADGSLTSTGVFVGKWRYASPEHIGLLEPEETIDGRADIFSMGIVLYELLAGQLPFKAETPGQYVLLHTGNQPGPVTPDRIVVPDAPGLEAVLAKMLERDRSNRYRDAGEVIAALEAVLRSMHEYEQAPPTMMLTPTPAEAVETARGTTEPPTVRTDAGHAARPSSSRLLIAFAAVAAALAIVIALLLVVAVVRLKKGDAARARTGVPTAAARPAGEVVQIPAVPPATVTETLEAETEERSPDTIPADETAETVPLDEPVTNAPTPTVPVASPPPPIETVAPKPAAPPANERALPPPVQTTATGTQGVATTTPAEPPPVSDTILSPGGAPFGRRSRRLVDDDSFRSGFRKGVILDYSDMWSRGGLDWVALAPGIRLADHRIRVSKFRNMTPFKDDAMMRYLNDVLQAELDDVTGSGEPLTTESAIFWAQETPEFGIGIEMVFRDSSGRAVAKIRHTHYEDSLEDAAQEMVDYIVEFVEDHEVVR